MEKQTNYIEEKTGTVISVDITDSTNLAQELNPKEWNKSINALVTSINTLLSGTTGKVIRFTGDGALLFFEDSPGIVSCDEAVNYSIGLCNSWKRYNRFLRGIIKEIDKIKIRITLDWGDLITNHNGGLWSGSVINIASKIRGEEDRVVITKNVRNKLLNNFYKKLFSNTVGTTSFSNKRIQLYGTIINLDNKTIDRKKDFVSTKSETSKIAVCLIGTGCKWFQVNAALHALFLQENSAMQIIVVLEKENPDHNNIINSDYKSNVDILYVNKDKSSNRSYCRNYAMINVSDKVETICFIDGDTILGTKVLKLASNIIDSHPDIIFAPQRIDLDYSIEEREVMNLLKIFCSVDNYEVTNTVWSNSIYSTFGENLEMDDKNISSEFFSTMRFLPSYTLFVPKSIALENGKWDVNFENWGEEDVDYTYRMFLRGCRLIMPNLVNFTVFHINHPINDGSLKTLARNAFYLISKYPELMPYRKMAYSILGINKF